MSKESGNGNTTITTSVPSLSEHEHQSLVIEYNNSAAPYPADKTIVELFEAQVERTPDQAALVFEQQRLTYRELNRRANQLAHRLRGLGVGPDVLVGLFVERSLEMIVGLLGILKAGAAYMPMDTAFPEERIAFMLSDAKVSILLTQTSLLESLPTGVAQAVCLDTIDWTHLESSAQSRVRIRQENLAYVIYTSGSTGRPKGVCIEHGNILNYVLGVGERLKLKPGMSYATVSTIAADLGNTVIFPALVTGGCLHIISQETAENQAMLSDYFNRQNIDVLKIVPSHLAALQAGNHPEQVMPRSHLIVGGEASRLDWIEHLRVQSPACEIYNHYGPTETTVGVLTFHVGEQLPGTLSGTLPLGRPLPNSRVYILDEHGQPVPEGYPGELCIGGLGVARGYLNRPDLTAEKFIPDPFNPDPGGRLYRTGDRARCMPDGNIEFCGRFDHQVKIRGYRVELGEIEGALREQHGVRDAVVVACEDESLDNKLVAYVVPKRPNQSLWGSKALHILPDGSPVAHLNQNETTYIYNEIFVLQAYLRHGIAIHDGDCIVDAGANIGLFTVFASRVARNLRIISCEPNPAAYECLNANAEAWGAAVKCLPLGLSRENKSAEMTVFGGFSLLSGFYADEATEREVVKTYALNQESESSYSEQLEAGIGELLEHRFNAKTESVELRTLSSVIAEEGLERIDLLKINVEKSELDVLLGISAADWPKILQLVVEVDQKESLGLITTLLEHQGYDVLVEQDPLLRKTELCYVYAIRPSSANRLVRQQSAEEHVRSLQPVNEEVLTPTSLRKFLKERLPQYMIPSMFMLMEKFPLTANGKIDRKALPTAAYETAEPAHDFARPQTEIEKAVALIWTELLKVDNIGLNDDFFDLGGHSLLAMRAVSRIRDVFGMDIPLRTLFENATIAGLANVLTAATGSEIGEPIESRKQSSSLPLSFMQEQLWFLDQLTPGSPVYNMGDIVDFHGNYNAEAMRRSINELVRRHEILRTAFSHSGGQPVQIILPEMDLPLAELDLSSLSERERENEWTRVVREQGRKPFDLSQHPLLRATMVHLSAHEHRLLLTIHHILTDEWSMEVVHRELKHLYDAFSEGRPSLLPEMPIQYADFACWQRNSLQGEVLESQTSYWKEKLAGAPFILELPTDKPRPSTQSFRGTTETFRLPKKLLEQLKRLGREQQATLFMILEAAFMALLHRYTGHDDIVIGTPISDRRRSETENMIGLFLNTVLLRAKFSERMSFQSLLQQVREWALGAYTHPNLPFEHLVAELAPERDPNRSPLFQVMFVLHNPDGVSEQSRVSGNHDMATRTSKFDLTLLLSETEHGLEGMIEYSTDLFEAATIRRMLSHFQLLLEGIVKNPDEQISELPLLTDAEREKLLIERNQTDIAHPKDRCLHELFEEQVRLTPEAVAAVFEDAQLTYRQLDERANQLAHHLQNLGVGLGSLVGVCLERSLEMVVALHAVLKAGGAYVPLDPSFPQDRLAYMVENSGMSVLVTHRELDKNLQIRSASIVRLDSDWDQIAKQSFFDLKSPNANPGNLAYVLYTSGSTGKPKGVEIPHSAVVNFLHSMQREPGFAKTDTLLAVTTLSFDIAGLELYLPLVSGGRLVIASHEDTHDPARLMERMRSCNCTVMQATPATWRALIDAGWSGSANLKLLCGGESLPRDLLQKLLPRCKELWNMYGPTETTIWSTIQRVTSADAPVLIGRPIANTQTFVLDGHRNLVPEGVVGELYIGGAGVARGYLGRPDLTEERFVQSPFEPSERLYRTGDLARWTCGGFLECLGRVDTQVKIRGYRIELGEIETALSRHEAVRQCVVVVREDTPGDKRLVAYFETRTESTPTVSDLRGYLAKELPDYMIPSISVPLEKLPVTPNGKIDRKALPIPAYEHMQPAHDSVEPRTEIEKALALIWTELLRVDNIGIDDEFFNLGGHSVLAIQVVSRIRDVFGVKISIQALFDNPTIADLANVLTTAKSSEAKTDQHQLLVRIRPDTSERPPFFCVPGAGGNVLNMRPLAMALPADFPFYCFQDKGLNDSEPFESVEETARCYLDEIRQVQPHGPYYLGGYCYGGLVAFEIARRLEELGEPVAALVLMEASNPTFVRSLSAPEWLFRNVRFGMWRVAWHARRMLTQRPDEWLGYIGRLRKALRKHLGDSAERAAGREAEIIEALPGTPLGKNLKRVIHATFIAASKFVLKPYAGRALIFRNSARNFDPYDDYYLGWESIVRGGIECFEFEGDHLGMLEEPAVRLIAEKLNAELAQSSAGIGASAHHVSAGFRK